LHENMATLNVPMGPDMMAKLTRLFDPDAVSGPRYNTKAQAEIDTEKF